jgi:Trk K+ transport system NAD-binding subunit
VLNDDHRVVGMLPISNLVRTFGRALTASSSRLTDLDAGTAASDVEIPADSPAVGMRLRSAGLPRGVLVTSITRVGDVVLLAGDTVLLTGHRLFVPGGRESRERIGAIVSPRPATP